MKLNDLRMTGNVYNKVDDSNFGVLPDSDYGDIWPDGTIRHSYLNMRNMVLCDPKLTEIDESKFTPDLHEFFRRFDDLEQNDTMKRERIK